MTEAERVAKLITGQHKGVHGILKALQSEAGTGIMGDERDLLRRETFFGKNKKPDFDIPPIIDSVKQVMSQKILKCVAALAIVSLITGEIYDPKDGWREGTAILFALFALVSISAWNDWMKDTLFSKIANKCRDEEVTVVRGKLGAMQKIDIWKLVVGDVVILNTGDKVPADCIIINSTNLIVQEKHSD